MKAFTIENTKNFMSKLLGSSLFDSFMLEEATIKTYNTFSIDGRIIPDFYDDYEFGYEYSLWKDIRPICFDLIKGKQLPVFCHFVMLLTPDKIAELLEKNQCAINPNMVKSFALSIKYSNQEITVITGTSFTTFIMDKTPDEIWDNYIEQFINAI